VIVKRLLVAAVCIFAALTITGCESRGFGEPPALVWLQNNSDQTVVLRRLYDDQSTVLVAKVEAHQKVELDNVATKYTRLLNWELADPAGNRLRGIGKICANDTIVYP
jgi:hypothetical protein